MRGEEAETFAAAVARDTSTEVVLASETNAEVVVTGVGEAVEADRAGTWQASRSGGSSLSTGGTWPSRLVLGLAMWGGRTGAVLHL